MNIQNAISQMRIQRKMGKLSEERQARILRRFHPRHSQLQWERMMALRAEIEKDVQPKIQAMRQAERDCFQVKWEPEATLPAEPSAPILTPLQMRLREAMALAIAQQWGGNSVLTFPKKRGRPSKAMLAARAAQAAMAVAA